MRKWKGAENWKSNREVNQVVEAAIQTNQVKVKDLGNLVKTLINHRGSIKYWSVNNWITNLIFLLSWDTSLKMKMMTFHYTLKILVNWWRSSNNSKKITYLKLNECKKVKMSLKIWGKLRNLRSYCSKKRWVNLKQETVLNNKE